MKRFLVCWSVLLLAVFVVSCGKEKSGEDDVTQYYIKCKIGSVDKTFNVQASAHKAATGTGETSISITGKANNEAANYEGIGFTMQSSIPLATSISYKETDPTTDYFLAANYNPNTQDPEKMFASAMNEGNPFQITFTEISETTVSGTFSGRLYLLNNTDPNADSAVLANGQFKVKLQ